VGVAEDIMQEAYLRLWKHREAIDWDRAVLGWLLVTARNLARNRFRALSRQVGQRRTDELLDETMHARWLDIRAAFGGLSPLERTALIMTAVEGWTYADAAKVLDTSEGALRAAVSRARQKLETA